MKKSIILTLIAVTLYSSAIFAQSLKFTITGNIEGIKKGDTLRFERVSLPSYESEKAFDIIIEKDGVINYNGKHLHTQYYTIKYLPIGTPIENLNRTRIDIVIKDGDIDITGRRDYIYYATVTNNFYDKSLQKIMVLGDSLEMAKNMIYSAMGEKDQDPKITLQLYTKYSSFAQDNANQYKRLANMSAAYKPSPASEYMAYDICTKFTNPLDSLETGYNKLSSKAKKSYYGTLLSTIIDKYKSLAPGESAPDFELITRDEEKITLANFKGKFLMIYLFGISSGSIESDPYVVDFYKKHKDTLNIIGITESMNAVNKTFDNLLINGSPEMKKGITSMLIHPWKNKVELEEYDNKKIIDLYSITGMPFFILINPNGKIVTRGFYEAFNEASKILSNK
ncbi:MAG: hypothetical protein RR770_00705 [Bacteroidales bacterium]